VQEGESHEPLLQDGATPEENLERLVHSHVCSSRAAAHRDFETSQPVDFETSLSSQTFHVHRQFPSRFVPTISIPTCVPPEADVESICSRPNKFRRVVELGAQISRLRGKDPIFISRFWSAPSCSLAIYSHVTVPCLPDFMAISSYGKDTPARRAWRVDERPRSKHRNRHVVILLGRHRRYRLTLTCSTSAT